MQLRQGSDSTTATNTVELARIFSDVPENFRELLLSGSAPLLIKRGLTLFERGDDGGSMYVVREGRIEISIITELGRKIRIEPDWSRPLCRRDKYD